MPEDNNQMPSEDEDFDITSDFEDENKAATTADAPPEESHDETNEDQKTDDIPVGLDENSESDPMAPDDSAAEEPEESISSDEEGGPDVDPETDDSQEKSSQSESPMPAALKPSIDGFTSPHKTSSPVSSAMPATPPVTAQPFMRQTVTTPVSRPQPAETVSANRPGVIAPTVYKKKRFSWHYVIEFILLVAAVGLGLVAWTYYSDRQDLNSEIASLKANPQQIINQQTQALVSEVGKLIQLPSGETPTIAVVSDAQAARAQSSFFDKADNGDKLLLYPKAGEAILFRPSTDKVIEVGPLTLTNTAGTAGTSTSSTSTGSVK